MHQFLGLVRCEYHMTIRRWGMWVAYGIIYLIHGFTLFAPGEPLINPGVPVWQAAGLIAFRTNLFMPLIGGIIAADRLQRDYRLGVRELQQSAPLEDWTYLIAKYAGVLAGIMTPVVLFIAAVGVISVVAYAAPFELLPMLLAAMLLLCVPAYAFVTIFSLACPLVMPVRVYQVLFTGYWFWGNFLTPNVMPTLSDTLLTPGGRWALDGFFGGFAGMQAPPGHTATMAGLNFAVLGICIAAAFVVLRNYMAWQARRA